MTTDEQVRILMKQLSKGGPLALAAAKAGMSQPTARKWRDGGKQPSESGPPRRHRTRADPFAALWSETEKLLAVDPGLQAKAVFEELQRRHPGQLQSGQLRTRQGPDKEVYFDQEREPGAQCQSDFTAMGKLG